MTTCISYEERRVFFENLKILVKPEYEEVYRILVRNHESVTENSNGIFFDVGGIQNRTFCELQEYMKFCLETRRMEEVRVKEMASLSEETKAYLESGYTSE
jgi:hypothetical protein